MDKHSTRLQGSYFPWEVSQILAEQNLFLIPI